MRLLMMACAGALLLGGCSGGDELELIDVHGKASYMGAPIEDGAVLFVPSVVDPGPQGRSPQPTRTAQIKNGEYSATDRGGVAPGTYRIEVHAYKAKPEGSADPAQEGGEIPEAMIIKEQVLPDEFNKNSTMEITIESGSEPIEKNFEL
jgi:hypothetical protein